MAISRVYSVFLWASLELSVYSLYIICSRCDLLLFPYALSHVVLEGPQRLPFPSIDDQIAQQWIQGYRALENIAELIQISKLTPFRANNKHALALVAEQALSCNTGSVLGSHHAISGLHASQICT